jgi:hypothetical protein
MTTEAVFVRDEIEYGPSPFGILVPTTIVTSFFDKTDGKKGPQPLRLAGRITYTYQSFKRFEVNTQYEIHEPRR